MNLRKRNLGGIKTPKARLVMLFVIMLIFCAVFLGRLVNLQFAYRDEYESEIVYANSVTVEIPTVRGEIADVNGVTLVSNKTGTNITFDKKQLTPGNENREIYQLVKFLKNKNINFNDILPVMNSSPYGLVRGYFDSSEAKRYVKNFANYYGISAEKLEETDSALYNYLYSRYGMKKLDIPEEEKRAVIGFRFTVDVNAYNSSLPYVIITNATTEEINRISDSLHLYPGLKITPSAQRYYNIDRIASHILGRTGDIYAEDAEKYREKGYNLTEKVGKTGAEYAFEEYLRGKNGKKNIIMSEDGEEILGEEIISEPKPGYTVRLTIDADMQIAAEKALEEVITAEAMAGRATYKQYDGEDANAGAVVVMDPRSGALRVVASYPTYSMNTYEEDIATLLKDEENAPLLNRATGGIYEPGSTFKIATAAAALHYGVTTVDRVIYDKGEFEDYPTYKPHCWVLDRHGYTHGNMTVLSAIQNSCNYYFFRVGKEMGIDKLNTYAKSLGLGVATGIETGESRGIIVSPEYKEANGLSWNPGDTLQAAIGQQHLFTPLQLASYISTVLNGGTRYKAHLFDSAVDYASGEVIAEFKPEVLSEVEISEDIVDIMKQAMRRVIDDGTASSTFINYKYPVGGKTGTAQVPNGSDNVIFVGFAPYDNPEIVVSVVLEHGDVSGNAAKIAKSIFDCYFSKVYPDDFGITKVTPDDRTVSDDSDTVSNITGDSDEAVFAATSYID